MKKEELKKDIFKDVWVDVIDFNNNNVYSYS